MKASNTMPVACFAPPMTDEKLNGYAELIEAVPEGTELREGLDKCFACVEAWMNLPESKRTDGRDIGLLHRGKPVTVKVVPLEESHVKSLWDVTPWLRDCEPLKGLFDTISATSQKELRDCAHDLLWHTIEISNDREPMTQDKLG